MKERDDLERQEEASSFCSSCRAAQSPAEAVAPTPQGKDAESQDVPK